MKREINSSTAKALTTAAQATSTKERDFHPKKIAVTLPAREEKTFCVQVKIAGNVMHDKTTQGIYSIKL